ncbi:MAG: hypothetical protein EOO02_09245 [Chitinophagaceae bacterium]|nr:MAG: hypothetical protein EOO02_09245 [Chitinophagaceae bacterium]
MMNTNRKVDEVMQSLEGIRRAEAPPFIPGRVLQKILDRKERSMWEKFAEMIARPSVAFALVFVVLLLNTYFFSFSTGGKNESAYSMPAYDYTVTDFPNEETENIWP